MILGRVAEKLHLVSEWAKKHAEVINAAQVIGLLRSKMDLRLVSGTKLIEIRVSSDDSFETARLANSIAETFRDFRLDQNRLRQTEEEKADSRKVVYYVEIVDLAAIPALPLRPNRPLAAAVFLFGSMFVLLGTFLITQRVSGDAIISTS